MDVLLWLQARQVLALTRAGPVRQLVSWCEVFPRTGDQAGDQAGERRVFLLLAGLGSQLLATLLETGGCAAQPGSGPVRPDPFYVDQALNTVEHLLEMGIPAVCDKWLTLPPSPDILDLDQLYEAASAAKRLDASTLSAASREERRANVILKKTRSYETASTESPSERSLEERDTSLQCSDSELSDEERSGETGRWEEERGSEEGEEEGRWWELYRSGQRSRLDLTGPGDGDQEVPLYSV